MCGSCLFLIWRKTFFKSATCWQDFNMKDVLEMCGLCVCVCVVIHLLYSESLNLNRQDTWRLAWVRLHCMLWNYSRYLARLKTSTRTRMIYIVREFGCLSVYICCCAYKVINLCVYIFYSPSHQVYSCGGSCAVTVYSRVMCWVNANNNFVSLMELELLDLRCCMTSDVFNL